MQNWIPIVLDRVSTKLAVAERYEISSPSQCCPCSSGFPVVLLLLFLPTIVDLGLKYESNWSRVVLLKSCCGGRL